MEISTLLLLSACFCPLTSSSLIPENGLSVVRLVVEEGKNAILSCSLSTKENIEKSLFDWKKDDQKEVFLFDKGHHYNKDRTGQDEQFKGRVFHFPEELKYGNASIWINNTKISDSGMYTCDFPNLKPNRQKFYIELVVDSLDKDRSREIRGAAREPYIKILNATEDGVLLQCEVRDASPKPEVEWQDSTGNILPAEEPQVTDRGDRYDITLLATVTKTDHFRCVVKQKEVNHVTSAETYAFVPGAAPKPYTKILNATEDGVLLQCDVLGASPKPEVEWQDSAGNKLHAEEPQVTKRGDRFDVTLLTTVTKTDHFRCVVKLKKINQIFAETYVSVPEKRCEDWAAWLFGGLFLGAAILATVQGLLVAAKCITISRNKGSPQMNCSCNGSSLVPLKTQPDC